MRTKEQARAYMRQYMKQYRLKPKKEPKVSERPKIAVETHVERPHRVVNTLVSVDDWLAENVNTKVFNVTMRNPNKNQEITAYGTQRILKVLARCGFKIVS